MRHVISTDLAERTRQLLSGCSGEAILMHHVTSTDLAERRDRAAVRARARVALPAVAAVSSLLSGTSECSFCVVLLSAPSGCSFSECSFGVLFLSAPSECSF